MFQPDAQEILDDLSAAIGRLYKENAILRSQLASAQREHEKTQHGEPKEAPKKVA